MSGRSRASREGEEERKKRNSKSSLHVRGPRQSRARTRGSSESGSTFDHDAEVDDVPRPRVIPLDPDQAMIPANASAKLRACMICSLIKSDKDFQLDGCENCEPVLKLAGRPNAYLAYTSGSFDGMIGVLDTKDTCSWVVRWQHLENFKKGMYAVSVNGELPGFLKRELREMGVRYRNRNKRVSNDQRRANYGDDYYEGSVTPKPFRRRTATKTSLPAKSRATTARTVVSMSSERSISPTPTVFNGSAVASTSTFGPGATSAENGGPASTDNCEAGVSNTTSTNVAPKQFSEWRNARATGDARSSEDESDNEDHDDAISLATVATPFASNGSKSFGMANYKPDPLAKDENDDLDLEDI